MRSMPFHFIAALATCWLFCFLPSARAEAPPEIWFAPLPAYTNARLGKIGVTDFQNLFATDADWRHAAANVKVFKFLVPYLRTASDADLATAIAFLKQHHIAIAIEIGLLHDVPQCPHLEGHDGDQVQIAQRIKRLGGELAYVAADEPLWFGHSVNAKPGCNLDLDALAQEAAATAKAIRTVFPNVEFVDIEPITNFKEPDTAMLFSQWEVSFARAFNEKFAAVDFDIYWPIPWEQRVNSVFKQLNNQHIPVGVICNGNPADADDSSFLANAKAHCDAFAKATGSSPSRVIFQSWVAHPTRVLPESISDSFTHLIVDYSAEFGR